MGTILSRILKWVGILLGAFVLAIGILETLTRDCKQTKKEG